MYQGTYVCVKNERGEPLMPTTQRKARLLLQQDKAIVIGYRPFTIQLRYTTGETKQDLTLGMDPGYKYIGFSIVGPTKELYSSEITLDNLQVLRNEERAMYRRQRRNRLRYRKKRFDFRKTKKKGWLSPSIKRRINTHLSIIDKLKKSFPLSKIVVEEANFDIQKINNPKIAGKEYQQGEQYGYHNVRSYVLERDGHRCQNPNCKNKSKNPILQTHHIGFWRGDYSDRPGNLITLCTKCHIPANHKKNGFLYGWEPTLKLFRAETFMSTSRKIMTEELKKDTALEYKKTYGYITKVDRSILNLPKSHINDAFCIAGGTIQKRVKPLYIKQQRKNNRSLETWYDAKFVDTRTGEIVTGSELHCGRRTRNKNENGENLRKYRGKKVRSGRRSIRKNYYSIRPYDIIEFNGKEYATKGVHSYGKYVWLLDPNNGTTPKSVSVKKIKFKFHQSTLAILPESTTLQNRIKKSGI